MPRWLNLFQKKSKRIPDTPGANRIYCQGSHVVATPTTERLLAGSESVGSLVYSQHSWALYCVAYTYSLAAVAHTRYLCYSPPLVWEAMLQVSYLQHCTQAQLT